MTKIGISTKVINGTELTFEELSKIVWEKVGVEQTPYSIISVTTYINPEMTVVEKVWHDGMTEYYYTV